MPVGKCCILCALLYREVRALCRVQGSTGGRVSLAQGHLSKEIKLILNCYF